MKHEQGKKLAQELYHTWEDMLDQGGLSWEVDYRIRKMIHRIIPLFDKIFIKTTKACEMMRQCTDLTYTVQRKLKNGEGVYGSLTDLENIFEELIRKTYEFRIKAG
mgnify:CR=1 FL=1